MFRFFSKIFDFFASLELAVFLILSLAIALAIGTVYESKYSAAVASQLVYRSWWMQGMLWLFMLNLAAAAFSRWPWRRHHIGFLITHLGIITLLLGSWVQQQRGVDGVLALAPGESGKMVRLDESALYLFRAVPGKTYDLMVNESLNFDKRRPMNDPVEFDFEPYGSGPDSIRILQYIPKAVRSVKALDVAEGKGVPALQIRLSGSRANFDDWLFLQTDTGTTREVGPARIRFLQGKPDLKATPEKATLYLYLEGDPSKPPKLAVARAGAPFQEMGRLSPGKSLPLGWMDFSFQLAAYHPSAVPQAEYAPIQQPIPGFEGYEVIEAQLGDEKIWLELGASGQVSVGDALYYIQYGRRQVDLGFEVALKEFQIGYYEGTTRPKTYQSIVEVAGQTHTIAMNEPLKHGGFTFYQASYEMDDEGKPRLSVLSVNYDPGREVKYLGSLMMVLGIVSMFYFKPKYSGSNRWLLKKKESSPS